MLDITRFRPLPAGLVWPDHPWVTGLDPATGGARLWHSNVVYRSPRGPDATGLPADDEVVARSGRFLADRVRPSSVLPELPVGPGRRMPHGINYIHGTSHYNSGVLVFTDFRDALRHLTDRRFRAEVHRFACAERREVLMLFRRREYAVREFAYFACAVRTLFGWFCNSNGPRGRVLWGERRPVPGRQPDHRGVGGRRVRPQQPGGADAVVRPPVAAGAYFTGGPYRGPRDTARWLEKALAWATYWRIRARGGKGGVFFADRREVYADQIGAKLRVGVADEPIARM